MLEPLPDKIQSENPVRLKKGNKINKIRELSCIDDSQNLCKQHMHKKKNEMKRIKTDGPQISKVHSFSTNALKDQIWK